MNVLNKIKKLTKDPRIIIEVFLQTKVARLLPDELFLRIAYWENFGKKIDLVNPQTFNEKLQWLKLYNRKPEYTMMADKYLVRRYIEEKIGKEYLIPLLGAWDDPEDIDFDSLPDQFVLKCNHNSGLGMYICRDKSQMDVQAVKAELLKGLKQDYFLKGREWPYKNIKHKIIAEKYMTDSPDSDCFTDYKFFCFGGEVDSVMICLERNTGNPKFYFFDRDWNLLKYNQRAINLDPNFNIPKPEKIDEMFEIARTLSQNIPHVRVDLYLSQDQIYFGELTFFSESGFDKNLLKETDEHWGRKIVLPH